jgi:hypothetical protein
MRTIRRAFPYLLVTVLATACVMPLEVPSPTPRPTETPSPSPALSGTPAPSPEPTPGPDAIPRFNPGSVVITNAPGLRVRSRPGTDQRVVTTLGVDADLVVGMGPIVVDDLAWYLVRDADPAEPRFQEGWVAAGFEPDPFLISGGSPPDDNPYLGGFADVASGEFGPVSLPDGRVAFRWIAATDEEQVCNFAVDLSAESGEPVRAVRTPVGAFPASGELPPDYFRANDQLVGNLFVQVQSNCAWAVSFVRVPRRDRES